VLGSTASALEDGLHGAFPDHDPPGSLAGLWSFLRVRKKFWLGPMLLVLLLVTALLLFTQGSPVAPFIYQLF
jgi:hypothetical protein